MDNAKILPGVPAMRYGNPSPVCYIGSIMQLMAYIGDPVEQDELFALSGAGLCFPWGFASPCDEVSIVPQIPAFTFEAFGYMSEYIPKDELPGKTECLEKIKESIDRGMPVLGFGITVDTPMTCLIVGYDEAGLHTRAFWPPTGENPDSEAYFYNTDWYENCAGLLIIGEKLGERRTGLTAYHRITEWALGFRCCDEFARAAGTPVYFNQYAYDEMVKWLLDDDQWKDPHKDDKEQYLKQSGLLLLQYYRNQLHEYLKKLDAQYPDMVNPAVFTALTRLDKMFPGAHVSDLWLHEVVDPALADFAAMGERTMREKVANYIRQLKDYDNIVQWTLFMPDFVKNQTKEFQIADFAYLSLPAMRFIGVEGEEFTNVQRRLKMMRILDDMPEYKSDFPHDLLLMHHYGLTIDNPWHGVWGRFMKADTPVPEGFISIDFVPGDAPAAGPPFYSNFAFATFSGDKKAMHSFKGFDSDAMYDVTRNTLLGDGKKIPYPSKYWTAEVFFEGFDKESTGYLFATASW